MTLTYAEAAANVFGRDEFTVHEFEARLGTSRGAKLLHEMKTRGRVERTGRGRYRMLGPDERPDRRSEEWRRAREAILDAPLAKAWTGPTAVEVWTGGRYRVEASPFRRVFHVAVLEEDLDAWRTHLETHGIPVGEGKRVGARARLEPRSRLDDVEHVDGEPVIPRSETVNLIRDHPALFADAEDLLVG